MLRRAWIVVGALLGCGGGGSDFPGHCDTRTATGSNGGMCRYWYGEETGNFEEYCTDMLMGAYDGGECPAESVVGRCDSDQLFGLRLTVSYYAPTFTTATAETDCMASPGCTQSTCTFEAVP
jgi:hypothetical protein